MVGKWHRHYICPVEEDLEELSKVSLGVRSISYYRSWTSQEMAAELEKVFRGLDACGGYCLCMKSGKFLKHVQSTVPDGKSLKGLFPKMVYIVPMQKDIEGMVDTNYNTEMIPCNDCGRNIARVKLLSHKGITLFFVVLMKRDLHLMA
ncbi:uncharacterized protein LOC116923370 [Daphnia magna]|uniref:uncharacterized protein LOC116923370 n=1 Tax=Daphnia magna TaxID=35525 RepID=UPI001E1BDBF3|nr:uncharacterized protein LOC116923370 [Daphnia magna]